VSLLCGVDFEAVGGEVTVVFGGGLYDRRTDSAECTKLGKNSKIARNPSRLKRSVGDKSGLVVIFRTVNCMQIVLVGLLRVSWPTLKPRFEA
jgi:hypothetical protein